MDVIWIRRVIDENEAKWLQNTPKAGRPMAGQVKKLDFKKNFENLKYFEFKIDIWKSSLTKS